MRILAIETSCDETGIAIVDGILKEDGIQFSVLSNTLLSQATLHAEFGGVYPNLAKREHIKNLPVLLKQTLTEAHLQDGKTVDGVAVTHGPGLEPALWSGIEFAKRIAISWDKPLLSINHMEGHLISSIVKHGFLENVRFPVLALLISGGHTEFVLMSKWFSYTLLGKTLDDAVGEAFDKVARMLGLPYPGGPHISRMASEARRNPSTTTGLKLPRPMIGNQTCDMSFSGLKTAVLYALRDKGGIKNLTINEQGEFAREFEDAVTEVFISKTRQALTQSKAKMFVIGGGVAANTHIRHSLEALIVNEFPDIALHLPELFITGDNAIMIAEVALLHLLREDWSLTRPQGEIRAIGNLSMASKK